MGVSSVTGMFLGHKCPGLCLCYLIAGYDTDIVEINVCAQTGSTEARPCSESPGVIYQVFTEARPCSQSPRDISGLRTATIFY